MMHRKFGIICFKHCNARTIFCKTIPEVCPLCGHVASSFISEPFVIRYPLADATQNPCSLAIKPSGGNFLETYEPSDDLHIAIVDSVGRTFEFDSCGVAINNFAAWKDCLILDAVADKVAWQSHWDAVLSDLSQSTEWISQNYDQSSANCFSFVMEFFRHFNHPDFNFFDKEDFCRLYVLPKIHEASRYISLYRNLRSKDYIIS